MFHENRRNVGYQLIKNGRAEEKNRENKKVRDRERG